MFWPFACGLTMAVFATGLLLQVYGSHLIECFISAFLLCSSTCTVNDIFDREIDAGVENFKNNGHLGWIVWCSLMVDYLLSIGFFQYVRS
ncbi:hypothetical protein J132_06848 [Termitomyces sp. J132]|nr:hypothetical protein J132_06848 [Termitomyces sp. J132]